MKMSHTEKLHSILGVYKSLLKYGVVFLSHLAFTTHPILSGSFWKHILNTTALAILEFKFFRVLFKYKLKFLTVTVKKYARFCFEVPQLWTYLCCQNLQKVFVTNQNKNLHPLEVKIRESGKFQKKNDSHISWEKDVTPNS